MEAKRHLRRALRGTLWFLGVVVVLLLVAAIVLLSGPGRRHVLGRVLEAADRALPGRFEVASARWDLPLDLRLHGVRWTDAADTLVVADTLRVSVDLGALRKRDVHLRALELRGAIANLDRLQASLAQASPSQPEPSTQRDAGWPWPLGAGSVPGLPSLAVDQIRVDGRLRGLPAAEGKDGRAHASLTASVDLRDGMTPRVSVHRLDAAMPDRKIVAQSEGLFLDLESRAWSGSLHGSFTEAWPFVLQAQSDGRRWSLRLSETAGAGPPADIGLQLDWRPSGEEPLGPGRLDLLLRTPSSERLALDPSLASALDSSLTLPSLQIRVGGDAELWPAFSATLDVEVEPQAPVQTARAQLQWMDGVLRLRDLDLRTDGLVIEGEVERGAQTQSLTLRGRLTDLGWAAGLVTLPDLDGVDLRFEARADGAFDSPQLQLAVDGSVAGAGRRLDDLRIRVDGHGGEVPAADFELDLLSLPYRGRTAGRATLESSLLAVDLAPIFLTLHGDAPTLPRPAPALTRERPTRVVLTRDTSRVEIDRLQVRGDVGEVDARGWFEPRVGAGVEAQVVGVVTSTLLQALTEEELARRLETVDWQAMRADLRADWSPVSGGDRLSGRATLELPGPARLGELVPRESFDVTGLDDLRVRIDADAFRNPDGVMSLQARIDPTPTSWIGGQPALLTLDGGLVRVDSLRLELVGLELGGHVAADKDSLRGEWTLALRDLDAVRARLLDFPPDLAMTLEAEGSLRGRRDLPELRAHLLGSLTQGELELPRFELVALARGPQLDRARLLLPQGIRGTPVTLDEAELGLLAVDAGRPGVTLNHLVSLTARGPEVGLHQIALVRVDSAVAAVTDSLSLRWRGRELRNRAPFTVRWDGASKRLDLRGLDLAGSLGRVVGEGFVQPDTAGIDLRLALRLPEPADGALRSVPLPDSLRAGIRTINGGRLEWTVDLDDLRLGEPVPLDLEIRGQLADPVVIDLRLAPNEGPARVEGHFEIDAARSTGPVYLPTSGAAVRGTVEVVGLALPARGGAAEQVLDAYLRGEGGPVPRADAQLSIEGRLERPSLDAQGTIRFPEGWPVGRDRVTFSARVDSLRDLRSSLDWTRADRDLLHADVAVGVAAGVADSLQGGTLVTAPLALQARAKAEDFDLADLDPLLPAGVSARGKLWFDVRAEGSPDQPVARGSLKLRELFVRLSDGSQARGRADVDLVDDGRGGTLARGVVRLDQGSLRVPDFQSALAPIEGSSLLWELEASSPSDPVSSSERAVPVAANGAAPSINGLETSGKASAPVAVEVRVEIPNGLWIRSDRLEVQMAGSLEIDLIGRQPVLVGTLTARSGGLDLLGQRFEVRRGEVIFFGGDAIDPTLDLVVGTRKGEVDIRVLVQGTALRPRLTLESDPVMSEADIFTYLIFGKEQEGLDSSQNELLRSEATRALQAFAIPTLERELSAALGLDLVRIGRSAANPQVQTLMAGKYLSPRALLSYEQSLEEGDSFFVTLRYWISSSFTMESRLGRSDPSSVQLNWTKDF